MEKYINEREVWLVDLEPTKGIEIRKVRPCLVFRKFSKTHFLVLPITSKEKGVSVSYCLEDVIFLHPQTNFVNISQVRTVDSVRFIRKFGKISPFKFRDIKKKTAEVLQLLPQGPSGHNSSEL